MTPRGLVIIKYVIQRACYEAFPKAFAQTGMKIAKNTWNKPVNVLESTSTQYVLVKVNKLSANRLKIRHRIKMILALYLARRPAAHTDPITWPK